MTSGTRQPTWREIRERTGEDEWYCQAYLWPPRPGLTSPNLARKTDAELAWWGFFDSGTTRRQVFAELVGRYISTEVTDLAFEGWQADGARARSEALAAILLLLDPAGVVGTSAERFLDRQE